MYDLPVPVEPDPQTRRKKIHCKQELIVSSLQRFYSTHPDKAEIIGLLDGTSEMSLRLIDWFVTNYSKQHSISYILNGQEFLVYTNYKSQLKAYSKKLFDPFCRRERIMFQIADTPAFMTTVGKLNFFRWALETQMLDYMEAHEEEIRTGYNTYLKETTLIQKRNKTDTESSTESRESGMKTTRRRTKPAPSSLHSLQVYTTPVELVFQ